MAEKIVVSSNCQTGGISAALKVMYPDAIIAFAPCIASDERELGAVADELRDATVWITTGSYEMAEGLPIKIVKVPNLWFCAFHPDLCYARKASTNEVITPNYNSRIALWSYSHRVEPADAVKLFNHTIFKELGYFDLWNMNTEGLRNHFHKYGYTNKEFDKFFLAVKRKGVFMHSVNHPRAETLVELTKMLAGRMGADQEMLNREIIIPDALTETIWPVYPDVGQELGFNGNYCWKMANNEVHGVKACIEHYYESYAQHGIDPSDVNSITPIAHMDSVLTAGLRKV